MTNYMQENEGTFFPSYDVTAIKETFSIFVIQQIASVLRPIETLFQI